MFTLKTTSRLLSPCHQRHLLQATSPALRKVWLAHMTGMYCNCQSNVCALLQRCVEADVTGMKDAWASGAGLHRPAGSKAQR